MCTLLNCISLVKTEKQLRVQRKGGEVTLCQLAEDFADKVPDELPALWENTTKYLNDSTGMHLYGISLNQNVC